MRKFRKHAFPHSFRLSPVRTAPYMPRDFRRGLNFEVEVEVGLSMHRLKSKQGSCGLLALSDASLPLRIYVLHGRHMPFPAIVMPTNGIDHKVLSTKYPSFCEERCDKQQQVRAILLTFSPLPYLTPNGPSETIWKCVARPECLEFLPRKHVSGDASKFLTGVHGVV